MKAVSGLSGLSALAGASAVTVSVTMPAGTGTSASWMMPENITSSDDSYASALVSGGGGSGTLKATNFGFSIPGGSTIVGIGIEIERSKFGAGVVSSTTVFALKASATAGTSVTDLTDWPASDETATYGGATSLWGTTWTADDINDTGFGAQVGSLVAEGDAATLKVDRVRITVWYQ